MKSLLALILVGALSPTFAVDHTVFHDLELDYKTSDNLSVANQCLWQGQVIGNIIHNKNNGTTEIQELLSVKRYGEDPEQLWSEADILFVAHSVRKIYADDGVYFPREVFKLVTSLCIKRRSTKPSEYIRSL